MRLLAETVDIEQTIWTQRERLVRLCSHFTGQADVAEDLAHEALIEAWRHLHNLRNPEALQAWLNGVTRNVCLRWLRHTGREAHFRSPPPATDAPHLDPIQNIPDQFDFEVELERNELAELLDRAMTALPAETRSVLIQKYVEDSPHAEIAARLGLSEGAVAMRLQRGKLALRRILSTDLRQEAQSYGFAQSEAVLEQETRLWCPGCGRHKLIGRLEPPHFTLRCPHCCADSRLYTAYYTDHADVLSDVKGFRRAWGRYLAWSGDFYHFGIVQREVTCPQCGDSVPVRLEMPGELAARLNLRGIDAGCPRCNTPRNQSLHGLALNSETGRRFWKQHERIEALPLRELTVQNTPALAVAFQAVGEAAQLEILFVRDTYEQFEQPQSA